MTDFRQKILNLLGIGLNNAKTTHQIYRLAYPDVDRVHPKGTGAGRFNAVQNALRWLHDNGYISHYDYRSGSSYSHYWYQSNKANQADG